VLRPGGRFLCLEFSHVTNPLLSKVYERYSFEVIPRIGGLVADDRASYQCVCLPHPPPVESRFGPKRGFGETPRELLTISKPNHYPKSVKPPGWKGFTKPNL